MKMRLVACERMSGTQCSKKTPLSLCFVEQLVCNGDERGPLPTWSQAGKLQLEQWSSCCKMPAADGMLLLEQWSSCYGKT
ncbi:unnamed protein product [Prunus armeniaca]